jgi:hypothetical protein
MNLVFMRMEVHTPIFGEPSPPYRQIALLSANLVDLDQGNGVRTASETKIGELFTPRTNRTLTPVVTGSPVTAPAWRRQLAS